MMRSIQKHFAILSLLTLVILPFANLSQADESSPWRLFAGFGSGYGLLSGDELRNVATGFQYLLDADISYKIKKWEFELGLDWIHSSLEGTTSHGVPVNIVTKMGMLALSPLYRVMTHFSLGPVFSFGYGTNSSFTMNTHYSPSLEHFMGLKGVYEFSVNEMPIHAWSQILRDTSIPDRAVTLVLVGIQVGFSLESKFENTYLVQGAK